jgi:glucosamine kinase
VSWPSLVELLPELVDRPDSRRSGAQLLLGIDGGATKTFAASFDVSTGELGFGHAGPSNPDAVGLNAAASSILTAARKALGDSSRAPDSAVLAIAGTNTESIRKALAELDHPDWTVVNDVVAAWATATMCEPGLAVISGTGSNVFGLGPLGPWRSGGWGHILGDEGSGYWLGLQSIKAVLSHRDASGPPTLLTDLALTHFRVSSPEELAALVYEKPLTKGEIAALARCTADAASREDDVALHLFDRAARDLSSQILAVVTQTGLTGAFRVGLIGSAFDAGKIFTGPLIVELLGPQPSARIERVTVPPVGGCLLLAGRLAGLSASSLAPEVFSGLNGR